MSVDVFAPTYDSAAAALLGANHSSASIYVNLTSYLNGSNAMAGNDSTSSDFAAAYDDQAQATVDALVDLVDATGNLSVLTATSIENHRKGDAAAVYTAPPLLLDNCLIPVGSGEIDVEAYDVPGSEGGDGGHLPALLDIVIDHVQGVFWPSADVSKLRATAQGWRYSVGSLDEVAATCQTAIGHLNGQRSPEIPLAISAIKDLKAAAADLADACDSLATACDDYADEVEHHRELIKEILKALAKEVGFTVGTGVLLTGLTAGLSNVGAAAAVGARAATYGARIVAVLSKLKTAVRVGAVTKLSAVGTKVKKVAPVLRRLAARTGRGARGFTTTAARGAARRPSVLRVGDTKLPAVPKNAVGKPTRNGKGLQYEIPKGTPELDPRVTSLRIMDPVTKGPHPHPDGYAVYMNKAGQTVDPITGETIGKANPLSHLRLPR